MSRAATLSLALAAALALPAAAADFRSVSERAVLYDAPSTKAKPLYRIAAGTPVELVVSVDAMAKLRDAKGDLAWIEKKYLAEQRTVMVRVERAQVRAAAEDKAALVFEAERDVVLDLVEAAPAGWAKVRHRGGQVGFVKAAQVWGL